jgi:hypothetical protein
MVFFGQSTITFGLKASPAAGHLAYPAAIFAQSATHHHHLPESY